MRITGLATGLDMDQVIKDSMKPYRVKIQQQQQNKEVVELKQKLYRDVLKDTREFYNKYFDITKSDSILLSKNWTTTKFESSNSGVITVTAGNDVKGGNYTVSGSVATAAKASVTEGLEDGETLIINGKEFKLSGSTEKERAANLNKELSSAGINVSVRYTEFAGTADGVNKKGFVFESTVLGANNTFTIGGSAIALDGMKVDGKDATSATITGTGFTIENLKNSNSIKIGDTTIDLEIDTSKVNTDEDIMKILNGKIKAKGLSAQLDEDGKIIFSTKATGSKVEDPKIEIGSNIGDIFTSGIDSSKSTNTVELDDINGKKISINGKVIDLSKATSGNEVEYLNKVLKEQKIDITAEAKNGQVTFTSNGTGSKTGINISIVDESVNPLIPVTAGTDGNITIRDSKGGVYTHTGNSNTVTLDGVTFKINGEIPSEGIKITGKNDITEVKDMIVNFVNDYNKVMEKLNTLTMAKRDRGYMPLTDEQKKEMSESEIKLWNERVEKGQLSRDSDITRITNSMKMAMSSIVEGAGGNLEKIGIKPVADYASAKNGTFTIDEEKLTAALENNTEEVMNLFISTPPAGDKTLTEQQKNNKTGVAQRLKSILYDETITVSSKLIKKAGIDGTASASNNELTKSIEKYDKKMKDMERDFSRREQALYSKYARLETMMNKLNSQQSYLASQLGM